ncbi:MAG: D-sedoheptulose 7-phosphate isomerase [Akkermansia muciniphila]|nr:D-sedoheptulose 7-phosphate isomerase [Akkermansia muciniphila]
MNQYISSELNVIAAGMHQLAAECTGTLANIAKLCLDSMRAGGKVMFCGNGGSAADAQHLAAELVGRYKLNRPAYAALALTTDTSILTAVGNDFGYDTVFERQVQGLGRAGDVLIGISTSGNSKNVLLAMQAARAMGIHTVAFTGCGGGAMAQQADLSLRVPSDVTNHIQEMHIACGHLLCGLVEKALAAD